MPATTPSPAQADRRRTPRYQTAFGTVCRMADRRAGAGLVCDLSRTGVLMLMAQQPQVGDVLKGELAPEVGGTGVPVSVKVVRVCPSGTGDYALGGEFLTPLSDEVLEPFVRPPTWGIRRPSHPVAVTQACELVK